MGNLASYYIHYVIYIFLEINNQNKQLLKYGRDDDTTQKKFNEVIKNFDNVTQDLYSLFLFKP